MFKGRVAGIYVGPEREKPMEWRDDVRAVEGRGLEGDRYFSRSGSFSGNSGNGRQVTLIESEAVEAAAREYGIELDASETRRNIVTEGVPLNHLVGKEFRVGQAVLRGMRLCHPCEHLESLTRGKVRESLVHRGGLRSEVVAGGTIRVGDEIEEV